MRLFPQIVLLLTAISASTLFPRRTDAADDAKTNFVFILVDDKY